MNRQKSILFVTVLMLIGATAGVLAHAKSNQRLGLPGVKTRPLAGSQNLEVILPADLPGFKSEAVPTADVVLHTLPSDTSFGQRLYTADDGYQAVVNVVLMGSSRKSIHKPQICLTAQGWDIDDSVSRVEQVHMDRPVAYDLPVMRLIASRQVEINGQEVAEKGVYAYWFVDADRYTAFHSARFLWMAQDVALKGELDRWAYVSFFSLCAPGGEDAVFDQMKKLITASVPEFQLVPRAAK
jgi:hypothetical protein